MLEFDGYGIDVDSGYYKARVICILTKFIAVTGGRPMKIGCSDYIGGWA